MGFGQALAFAIAALIAYVPATVYPVIEVKAFEVHVVDFIWTGTAAFWSYEYYAVATWVFLMSMAVPLLRLVLLIFAGISVSRSNPGRGSLSIVRVHQAVAEWWMADVFMLAALVSLIRMAQLANTNVGPGLYALAALIILTLAASLSFEPRAQWLEKRNRS